jgi:Sec-independent protein translocase protein TatA
MDILGIGPLEFGLILVLALILLGPKGMVETSQKVGSFIKKIVRSDGWRSIVKSTREIRQAQDRILQETGLQETLNELRDSRFSSNSMTKDLPEEPQQTEDLSEIQNRSKSTTDSDNSNDKSKS